MPPDADSARADAPVPRRRARRRARATWWSALAGGLLAFGVGAGCSPPGATPAASAASAASGRSAASALERDAIVAGRRLRYGLHLAPLPNLIYQLDCVAGAIVCARPVYREFWSSLGLDAGDEAALADWKALRLRHGGEIRRVDRPASPAPLLVPSGAADVGERQRIAGLLSRTPAAYEASMGLLSTDDDARRLRGLLARFAPRFERWWHGRGYAAGSAAFDGFARLLADPFFDAFVDRAERFYRAELPGGPALDVHLMVQPASRRKLTAAYQLEAYAAVEVPEGARPEAHVDVMAHELFHYFFGRMRPEERAKMLERVVASDDPLAAASFGVLDEAVAAALGNGLVARHYLAPDAFAARRARDGGLVNYRDAGLVARALLPSLEGFLERGVPVSSGEFLRAYFAAARAMYERGADEPLDYLHSHVAVASPRFGDAARRLQGASDAGFPYLRAYEAWGPEARAFLAERPLASAALLLGSDERPDAVLASLGAGAEHVDAVAALVARARGFAYGLRRSPKSYAFLLVARDAPSMDELVARLSSFGDAREGVLVELPK